MSDGPRNILVTAALPYANGSLHLGHCLEHIQADIWVRFQRLMGNTCHFVCGSDAHGTPIMLSAETRKTTPEALVAEFWAEHSADMKDFHIGLDEFYTTHSPENQKNANYFFEQLQARGDIAKRTITQFYDAEKEMFLPDRYLKGNCPKCDAADQYGDNCEVCGASYDIHELKSPRSVLTGSVPVERETEHFFFELGRYQTFLKEWMSQGHLQKEVANKLGEWLEGELRSWDISRDGPYFGFEIPGAPNRYFYVWLDAPMGYIAAFEHYANRVGHPEWLKHYWAADSKTELYHFIGKDIIYFHGLFWPALLQGAGYRLPSGIFAHGFVTVQGQKMSKSRGTFITARHFLNNAPAEALRYYFACKLSAQISDIDLDTKDLAARVNSDLVGKYANLASRCSTLLDTHFDQKVCAVDGLFFEKLSANATEIANHYEQRNLHLAMAGIRNISDALNRYIDEHKVWQLVKNPETRAQAHTVLSTAISGFRLLTSLLKPVLPETAKTAEHFLNSPLKHWSDALTALPAGHQLNPYAALWTRIQESTLEALVSPTTPKPVEAPSPSAATPAPVAPAAAPETSYCTIDDFAKVSLRVGRILEAAEVPDSTKLLKLLIDLGPLGKRQVFSGIRPHYTPDMVLGKLVVLVANLQPRKMRFGTSEAMVLIAASADGSLHWVQPTEGAMPGDEVR